MSTADSNKIKVTPQLPRPTKDFQDIQGFEPWTREDDQMLLKKVFSDLKVANWRNIESQLQGRHKPSLCEQRWKRLQAAMLLGLDEL